MRHHALHVRLVRALVTAVAALVAALFGAASATAATDLAVPRLSVYAYDVTDSASALTSTPAERGPPEDSHPVIAAHDDVDRWSNGVPARPHAATPRTITTYDPQVTLAHLAHVATMTRDLAEVTQIVPSSLVSRHVAANTVRGTSYPISEAGAPLAGNRVTGINRAWAQERDLLHAGGGTRNWTADEARELWMTGQVKGYTGHHINSVDAFPGWAGDPRNIRFLNNGSRGGINEHLYGALGHGGAWQNATSGNLIDRLAMTATLEGR